MNDKELADAIVALGVGAGPFGRPPPYYQIHGDDLDVAEFVRDWRVAGAMLQLWPTTINTEHLDMTLDEMLRDPRAINEACVRALSDA